MSACLSVCVAVLSPQGVCAFYYWRPLLEVLVIWFLVFPYSLSRVFTALHCLSYNFRLVCHFPFVLLFILIVWVNAWMNKWKSALITKGNYDLTVANNARIITVLTVTNRRGASVQFAHWIPSKILFLFILVFFHQLSLRACRYALVILPELGNILRLCSGGFHISIVRFKYQDKFISNG